MEDNLFGGTKEFDPAISVDQVTLKRKLELALAAELLINPPVKSTKENEVGIDTATRNAGLFAKRDLARVFTAAKAAGITITLSIEESSGEVDKIL
jgi:hypothetical protein